MEGRGRPEAKWMVVGGGEGRDRRKSRGQVASCQKLGGMKKKKATEEGKSCQGEMLHMH